MFKQRHEEDQATKLVVIWKKVGVQFAGKKKQYVDKFQEMEKRDREEVKKKDSLIFQRVRKKKVDQVAFHQRVK